MTISRPPSEVFAFCRDFSNMPRYMGDIVAAERAEPSCWNWVVQGPLGVRIRWKVRVTHAEENHLLRYETQPFPGVRAQWEMRFSPGSNAKETEVAEELSMPFGRAGRTALALIGKFPAQEVRANLRRLKEILETGRVTYTEFSARGKTF